MCSETKKDKLEEKFQHTVLHSRNIFKSNRYSNMLCMNLFKVYSVW